MESRTDQTLILMLRNSPFPPDEIIRLIYAVEISGEPPQKNRLLSIRNQSDLWILL